MKTFEIQPYVDGQPIAGGSWFVEAAKSVDALAADKNTAAQCANSGHVTLTAYRVNPDGSRNYRYQTATKDLGNA